MQDHPFFRKSRKEQKRFQIHLVLASLVFLAIAGGLLFIAGLLPLIFVVLAIVLSLVAPFIDVPGMVRAGKLRYFSPFLLCEEERNHTLVLHTGTLFDFYFMFPANMPAGKRKRLVLSGMVDGLLKLIEHYEERGCTELTVRTTSYILNERTARKLGLEKRPTDGLQVLILYYNYFNLAASHSLLNRRLRVPAVKSVQTFEGRMARLIEQKAALEKLERALLPTRSRPGTADRP